MRTTDRTGVEMEALTAVSVAALTVVDMVKAVDKAAVITDVRVESKTGGRSGDWSRRGRMTALRAAVVVASNRAAAGVYEDTTGPLIVAALREAGFEVGRPGRRARRRAGRRGDPRRGRRGGARAVLTTGGTGLTPTDLTPEVTRALLDREVPGIAEAIRAYGVGQGRPTAALSRGLAGVSGRALVVNLPGLARRGEGRARGRRTRCCGTPSSRSRERPLSGPAAHGRPWGAPAALARRVGLRPLRPRDRRAWNEVRTRNAAWLQPVGGDPAAGAPPGHRVVPRHGARPAAPGARTAGACRSRSPWTTTFAGQVTVTNIVGGSAQFGPIGYWIDRAARRPRHHADRGRAGHRLLLRPVGLHRIEVAIRPENTACLRVVEKLGFTEVGFAPRYLHIDGDWRDHRLFAITREEAPQGLLRRFLSH